VPDVAASWEVEDSVLPMNLGGLNVVTDSSAHRVLERSEVVHFAL
jgi:hypothetical protein